MVSFSGLVRTNIDDISKMAGKAGVKGSKSAIAREAAENASKAASKAALKDGDNAVKTVIKNAGKTVRETLETATKEATEIVSKHKKALIGSVAVSTVAAVSLAKFERRDGKVCDILGIESKEKSLLARADTCIITYSPSAEIVQKDHIVILNSNCIPSIDGIHAVKTIISDTQVEIKASITSKGNAGRLTVQSSFGNQFLDTVSDTGGVVGKTAGAGIGGLFKSFTGEVIPEWMMKNEYVRIIIGIVMLIILIKLLFIALELIMKKKKKMPKLI